MKIQRKEKKKFFTFLIAILLIASISFFSKSFAMKYYQEVDFATGLVTAKVLNVRTGPGLTHKIISKVYKDQYIRIFAKIDNWYVVQTDKDIVGVVYADYIKPIYPKEKETAEIETEEAKEVVAENKEQESEEIKPENIEETKDVVADKLNTTELTKDEKEVFDTINKKRVEAGLDELKIDDDLQNICRIKAGEMVEKEYFSHNSPTYGTPFEMLKKERIEYKVAGENIAGNADNQKAVEAWMNSENHKANIINKGYNYTGVAVVNSPKYGKIYVQIFIGR